MNKAKLKQSLKNILIFSSAIFLMGLLYFEGNIATLLRTSVLNLPEHAPFDGTVYPIQKVPNWVGLSTEKWKSSFNELSNSDLTDVPYYDPDLLAMSVDELKWGDKEDDKVRNAKITYPVPYMGNYKLNGLENSGSHPAVDIKVPEGTPVYSIANGTVIKVANQSSGFGKHIVVMHRNVPKLDSKSKKTTIFSSYSHLSEPLVYEGEVVKKGQQIGLSGRTGTATTPHVHFQIDSEDAPWSPYWPFTTSDAKLAGLDFFGAINAGLGAENAREMTIHPLKYVQKYLDEDAVFVAADVKPSKNSSDEDSDDESDSSNDSGSSKDKDDESGSSSAKGSSFVSVKKDKEVSGKVAGGGGGDGYEEEAEEVSSQSASSVERELKFDFEVAENYYLNGSNFFTISVEDQFGKPFQDGLSDEVYVTSVAGNFRSSSAILDYRRFEEGEFRGELERLKIGRDRIQVKYKDETYNSDWFEIKEGNNEEQRFTDVPKNSKYFEAVSYLAGAGVVNGYQDGTFKPDQKVNRVEALKFIYEGTKQKLSKGKLPFKDTDTNSWYVEYLYTAYKRGVVSGYNDSTFKPNNVVSKAEFLKMLYLGMDKDVSKNIKSKPFEDVEISAWYAPYVVRAKKQELIEDLNGKFYPNNGMTRGEVAYAIYKLMNS